MAILDHKAVGSPRILTQFQEFPEVVDLFDFYFSRCQRLEQILEDLKDGYIIDNSRGYLLDILGRVIGEPRKPLQSSPLLFGFDDAMGEFGSVNNLALGAPWYSKGTVSSVGLTLMSDPVYRRRLKLRIHNLSSECTINDTLTAISILLDRPVENIATYSAPSNGVATITFTEQVSPSDQIALGDPLAIWRPLGVRLDYVFP